MDQLSIMANIERADVVITIESMGDGNVMTSTYTSSSAVTHTALARFLREYADSLEQASKDV